MKVLTTASEIGQQVQNAKSTGKIVGLVPTMGALHQGHVSLVKQARRECDLVVVSIFVNPTQFNDPQDFSNYPRDLDSDLKILNEAGCDIAFTPDYPEVYPAPDDSQYVFGDLESRFEGAHRPGHFRGVGMVVRRFLEIVQPDKAFFGLKDFQQLMIIKSLVQQFNLKVQVIEVPTIREEDGLAMSSRNQLLSPGERANASEIFRVLQHVKFMSQEKSVNQLSDWVSGKINHNNDLSLEYFAIADPESLQPITDLKQASHAIALIAVRAGKVRLIDNLQLF